MTFICLKHRISDCRNKFLTLKVKKYTEVLKVKNTNFPECHIMDGLENSNIQSDLFYHPQLTAESSSPSSQLRVDK